MGSLRIAIIPDMLEAMHTSRHQKEALLDAARQEIIAQNIADLTFGFVCVQQCVLWIRGTTETIAALRPFLDAQGRYYEIYGGTETDSDVPQREKGGTGSNPSPEVREQ
ncbi:MAG: hypothetical protein PHX87_01765 [Candidatus Peribacteraceae bacterium]|nr:hypothetical protein [Candidatus Peribacteraceae bacterium]MDD5742135.1 hypothetical protein [Candidatus Peribacteraceae bacterium]